jgi:hypothetical protein
MSKPSAPAAGAWQERSVRQAVIEKGRRQMRRTVVLLVALGCLASGAVPATGAPGWKRFVHPTLKFALSYPASWTVVSQQGAIAVAVVGPQIAGAPGMNLSVNVASEILPKGMTLEQYESATESKIALVFSGYQRLRTDRPQVGARAAVLRYFTWKRNDGLGIYQMQLYMVAGRRAYVVTATTTTSSPSLEQEAALLRSIMLTFNPGT